MESTTSDPIPLRIVPDPDDPECCAQIVVEVSLCDVVTPFVLDTGARRSALAPSAVVDALPRTGSEASSGAFSSVASELVRVPALRLGALSLIDAELMVATGPDAGRVDGVDLRNLLGMDLLGVRPWELRFSDATLRIAPPASEMVRRPLMTDAGGHVSVEARFDGVDAMCVWDTGAGITVMDTGFADRNPGLFTVLGTDIVTDANLTRAEMTIVTLAGCRVGDVPFAPSKAAIVDLARASASSDRDVDLILGYPLMRHADWWVDVPGREWSVTRR